MKLRVLLTSLALALAGLAGPGVVLAESAHAATVTHAAAPSAAAKHKHHKKHHHKKKHHKKKAGHSGGCTTTSSGSCIRGGEFCPKSSYGDSGYSASGKKYICQGDHDHPHWENP